MEEDLNNHEMSFTFIPKGNGIELRTDLYCYTIGTVNTIMLGDPNQGNWVMVDAGAPGSGQEIISASKHRFGSDNKPSAILLTHGHAEHVGGIREMLQEWEVPVYAHPLEIPFLSGEKDYAEPDPSANGEQKPQISFTYPFPGSEVENYLLPLPNDHTVPCLNDWIWVSSAGHSPGHVSYYRSKDRTLISGDAFTSIRQDNSYRLLNQEIEKETLLPFANTDWRAALDSVKNLELLHPSLVVPGRGHPAIGREFTTGIRLLVNEFDRIGILNGNSSNGN